MEVYQRNPNIYILAFGMLSAKITNKLVVSYNHSSMLILSLQNAVIQSFFFFFFLCVHVMFRYLLHSSILFIITILTEH